MVKPRVPPEDDDHGEADSTGNCDYNTVTRYRLNRGWVGADLIISEGIKSGLALEIGPGPGYLGLEWLSRTEGTRLWGLDISNNMTFIAVQNADKYGLKERVEYFRGDAWMMPFEDECFDSVFSNGSLHEWTYPERILNEVERVLKPGGRYVIADHRRDMNFIARCLLRLVAKVGKHDPYTPVCSSYIPSEIEEILLQTRLRGWQIKKTLFRIIIVGRKPLW